MSNTATVPTNFHPPLQAINLHKRSFLAKLEWMSKARFNAESMQAELSNHEYLRDLVVAHQRAKKKSGR